MRERSGKPAAGVDAVAQKSGGRSPSWRPRQLRDRRGRIEAVVVAVVLALAPALANEVVHRCFVARRKGSSGRMTAYQ